MTVTVSQMRTRFPDVFGSTTIFPDTMLDLVLLEAMRANDVDAWDDAIYDDAVLYYAAHLALLGVRRWLISVGATGNIQSLSTLVGSVSYDTASSSLASMAEGFMNLWLQLVRRTTTPLAISGY